MNEVNFERKDKEFFFDAENSKTKSKNYSGQRAFFQVDINKDKCKGCGLCIIYCPFKCLEFSSDLNRRGIKYAKKKKHVDCKGCGRCYLICPDCAIEVYKEVAAEGYCQK